MACLANRRDDMASKAATEEATGILNRINLGYSGDRKEFYAIIALGAAAMWAITFFVSTLWIKVLYALYMYIAFGSAWNLLSGYTGYPTFGPMLFIGSGAYATAFFDVHAGLSWAGALTAAVVVSAVLATVLGVIMLRISGIYFAIGTLLVAEAAREGVLMEDNLLGGSTGITLTRLPTEQVYILFAGIALASIIITYEVATSRFGLRMLAIREDEEALRSLGVNPIKYKVPAFAAHGAITALAGGAFALSLGFIFPTTVFSIDITVTLILVVILGGLGRVWGPVLGTLILIPLQELFWLEFPALHIIAYGLFLVGVIVLMPEGIISRLRDLNILPQTRGL